MEKVCIVLVGNVGSGKSTFVNSLVSMDYAVISRDNLRYALGGGTYIFKPEYEYAVHKIHIFMLAQFLRLGVNIVVDNTNVSVAMRKEYIVRAKTAGYKVMAIEFPRYTKEESVARRFGANHGTYSAESWSRIWESFDKRYNSPTTEEGFDIILKLTEDVPAIEVWRVVGAEFVKAGFYDKPAKT